ncbi:MAG: hypothetical protein LBF91_09070 [Azoarcus sp.]|jgi:flagellum-specific peptidoglycan hydrolase FlgJ|nr:hypothetical protein [Azoarcus sp.]
MRPSIIRFSLIFRELFATPRHAGVLGKRDASAFARGRQSAGHATDPMSADKLMRIIVSNTLRSAPTRRVA